MTSADRDRLTAHAAECDACQRAPLPVEHLAGVLAAGMIAIDPTRLSQLVLARVRPELERHARHAFWRRVIGGMVLARNVGNPDLADDVRRAAHSEVLRTAGWN